MRRTELHYKRQKRGLIELVDAERRAPSRACCRRRRPTTSYGGLSADRAGHFAAELARSPAVGLAAHRLERPGDHEGLPGQRRLSAGAGRPRGGLHVARRPRQPVDESRVARLVEERADDAATTGPTSGTACERLDRRGRRARPSIRSARGQHLRAAFADVPDAEAVKQRARARSAGSRSICATRFGRPTSCPSRSSARASARPTLERDRRSA